ncbi:PAS domain-containing protein [Parvibaculaceae bacterium PLY_AMNH_Bact1]|nr:PAS domain-containing protein [Parvibaculaceae bacterium PLY_AMNH_Bact1]
MSAKDPHIGMRRQTANEWQVLDYPTHDKTKALFDYWNSKRGDHLAPLRSSIDPIDVPSLLPTILLLEVEGPDPLRFKVRVYGTAIVTMTGEERTGRYLDDFGDDLTPSVRNVIIDRWQSVCLTVVREKRPVFVQGMRRNPERTHQTVHVAALPLTTDGMTVSHLLGAMVTEAAASA